MNNETILRQKPHRIASKNSLLFHGITTVPGIFVAATNALIILVIYKHKKLHQKTWFLLASLALSDSIVGLSFGIKFTLQMVMYLVAGPGRVVTAFECIGTTALNVFMPRATGSLTLAVAVDRVMAVTAPIKYKVKFHNGYVALVSCLAWGDGLVHTLVITLFNKNWENLYGSCRPGIPIPVTLQVIHQSKVMTTNVMVVIVYLSILLVLEGKIVRAKMRSQYSAAMDTTLQTKATRTIGVVLITFIGTTLARSLALVVVRVTMPHVTLRDTIQYTSILMLVNSGANLFIFTAMTSEFRNGFLKLIKGKPTTNVIQLPPQQNNNNR